MIKRKLIKNKNVPVTCSYCKKKNTHKTIHGIAGEGGKTCCDDCYKEIIETPTIQNNTELSEAEHKVLSKYKVY